MGSDCIRNIDPARKALYSTFGAQIVFLSLVKPVVWFARAVVN